MRNRYTTTKSVGVRLICMLGLIVANISASVIIPSASVSPVVAQPGSTQRADAVVLVNSASANYADFQRYVQPYLDHFGIPYSVLDIATTPVGTTIADYAVIIIGHRRLDVSQTYLSAAEQSNIVTAVNSGNGLVSFDNDLAAGGATPRYQFVQSIFGFGYVTPPTAANVTFTTPTHYITERHATGETITTGNMTLAGVTLPAAVTALATSGTQPFLAVTSYGAGRAVQWGTYNWMSHAVKGPMYGLDDLVWRSLVWAARKPFVMQGMPPFVTMRIDDVTGPMDWIHIANEVGIKPWVGIFLNNIDETEAADLASLAQAGSATIGIHAFTDPLSFYYNQYNGNYSDAVMAANYATGTQWFTSHNITPSKYVAFHHYEVGSNAFAGLTNWGVQFVATHQPPGQPEWYPSDVGWLPLGPYRLYESGPSTSTRPVYYADYLPIPGHPEYNNQFFNCVTEVRDEQVYEWIPTNDVAASVLHGTRQLQRGLDGMVVPTLFAHQYNMVNITNANWRAIMQGIASNIAPYQPQYVTIDTACQYARAMYTSSITGSVYDATQQQVTTILGGSTDLPTKFYMFLDNAGQIQYQLINVPTFSGTTQVIAPVLPVVNPDTTPPTVTAVTPLNGAANVSTSTAPTVRFSEAISVTTITSSTFEVRNAANVLVPASISYDQASRTATLTPSSALANSSAYTAIVKSGSAGVKDLAGNALASDYVWTFTTAAAPPPPPSDGPGGPIMVIASSSNPFGRYYGEILQAEGFNAYTVTDISLVNATILANQDVVILGEMALTAAQSTMLGNWVTAGGNLIAMRPDKQLAGMLGLADANATLADAYLLVNTAAPPGTGIVGQTIQFHGTADRYTLNGATSVAALYSNGTTPTANPAVTLRSVGANGGQAAAFTYDLARSVVTTRQGNPAWSGQDRDGAPPIRANDLFWGGAEPNWIDLDKVAIPQADEQQRLLANLILHMNADKKPLPRFWYFPRGELAVVIMTSDQHWGSGTPARFDDYKAKSPANCSVADWECVRSTAYMYTSNSMTNAQAAAYTAEGFEIALHVNLADGTSDCGDPTAANLAAFYASQLNAWQAKYTSLPAPVSERTHCISWGDYVSQPKVQFSHGIRLDTNYYYYPASWAATRPGFFTGSGMPMRFADLDGTLIDVFQAVTQMTDESGQSYPATVDTLLDRALGSEGYYGAFTAIMHSDEAFSPGSDAIVASAQAHSVPVISARQMLTWLDGRNNSSFGGLSWSANTLSFSIAVGTGATGLQAMLPTSSPAGTLATITRSGTPVAFTLQTRKGVQYATFTATIGNYVATYSGSVPPTGTPTPTNTPGTVIPTPTNTPTPTPTATTPSNAFIDTSVTDFGAGILGTNTYVAQNADGELLLAPTVGAEFLGTALPSGWFVTPWATGGSASVGTGALSVDGALAGTNAYYSSSGHSLEFVATFRANTSQHLGFGTDLNGSPWAIFSTGYPGGTTLQARTANGTSSTDTNLGAFLDAPHRFRIVWNPASIVYYVDDVQVATHPIAIGVDMRPVISDEPGGAVLTVDWLRMSPYAASGSFTSRLLDAGTTKHWLDLTWTGSQPAGTSASFESRSGNSANPDDGSWSPWTAVSAGIISSPDSRYIQYRSTLASTDSTTSISIERVVISYGTPTASTATPTSTPTGAVISTPTPTATPTNTSVPPTSTPTNTAPAPTTTPTNTPVPPTATPTSTATTRPDLIFQDGFESGGLTGWTSSATNGGALSASSAAALVGANGLRAAINSNTAIYVTDDTPATEPRYRARFYFDPNSITMTSGNAHYIFYGYSGASTVVLRIEYRFQSPNRQIRAALINNATTWTTSSWFTISDAPHFIEIDWAAATASGANNGYLTLWIDGVQQANLTAVANDTRRIDRIRLGAVAGLDTGTRGTYYFDALESRRLTYIGPASTITPTPTNTSVPATSTATPTSTAVPPTPTPTSTAPATTATPTSTAVPPTSTPTGTASAPTATPTSTLVPPTPTPTSTASAATATPTPVTNMVAFWRFSEVLGSVASDSSGYGNNGAVSGASWTTGKVGGALSFDGTSNRVAVANSTSLRLSTNRVTIAYWVYPNDLSNQWSTIIQRSNVGASWFDWQIYNRAIDAPTANHPVFRIDWNANGRIDAGEEVQGDIVLQANTWYFIAVTYDGVAMNFYIDGTLRGTTAKAAGAIPNSSRPIWIGGNDAWGEYFAGKIDEFRIYDRALDQAEIQALMASISN